MSFEQSIINMDKVKVNMPAANVLTRPKRIMTRFIKQAHIIAIKQ
jgi:hypothetical protein